MRLLALASGGVFLFAAAQQSTLPAPLQRHLDVLGAAPSLTVDYTLRVDGEAPKAYRLLLSRPDEFKLTTPTGFVVSDGKTVTTYKAATKTYAQEPYAVDSLSRLPEAVVWSPFFGKKGMPEIIYTKAGADRTVGGSPSTEVEVVTRKTPLSTLYIDKKLGIVRAWSTKGADGKETLVTATKIEIGKEPLPVASFAFIAPEGASKEAAPAAVAFAPVKALIDDRCMPCHGGARPRAGIGLDSHDGIAAIVTPGKPNESLLIKAVKGDGVKKMPIGNHPALNDAEIKLLSDWILAGAKAD